ncbi:MAG TPA: FtsQ-type POTRA domain-containing protein [bacterium]|nr:FtsQ-type POTRA domain-containing protein [bacterium]
MRIKRIEAARQRIDFCYRPPLPRPPVKKRHSRTWPKGIASLVTVGAVGGALVGLMLFAPTRAVLGKLFDSLFSVRQILIEAPGDIDTTQAASSCLGNIGRSLLDVSVGDMRSEFASMPSVKSATVKKLYPSTLVVNVQGRRARFVTELKGRGWGLSDDGVLVPLPSELAAAGLPSLQGLTFSNVGLGGKVQEEFLPDLVSLCDSLLALGYLGPHSRVEVVDQIEVRVWPHAGGTALVFSLDAFNGQIHKYVMAKDYVARQKGEFRSVDLRFRGQIILRKKT